MPDAIPTGGVLGDGLSEAHSLEQANALQLICQTINHASDEIRFNILISLLVTYCACQDDPAEVLDSMTDAAREFLGQVEDMPAAGHS